MSYDKMTVAQLRAACASANIRTTTRMTKQVLIELLQAAPQQQKKKRRFNLESPILSVLLATSSHLTPPLLARV